MANLIGADLLVFLTDIDALYDANPRKNPGAKRISVVEEVTDNILSMAGEKGSIFSVGGMETKLLAAKRCRESRTDMVIALGEDPRILNKIIEGEDIGTLFINKEFQK